MKSDYLIRQRDIIPIEVLGENITIIGAGAIGGWVTLNLAKMGFSNLTVIDYDSVSEENMNSQFYRIADIGLPKVAALQFLVKDFTGVEIQAKYARYEGEEVFKGIVVSAVDSMGARRLIWDKHKGSLVTRAIIDPRMGAESALLYVMKPGSLFDIESYEKTLYSDNEAVAERCTAKATMYTVGLLSSLCCKGIKDLLVGMTRSSEAGSEDTSEAGSQIHHQGQSHGGVVQQTTTPVNTYLRTAQWNISQNVVQLWNSKGVM